MDRGAWWATDHGVAKSRTQLSDLARKHLPLAVSHTPSLHPCIQAVNNKTYYVPGTGTPVGTWVTE